MFTVMESKLWTGLLKLLLLLLAVSYFLIFPPPFTAKFERQPVTSSIPVKFEFTHRNVKIDVLTNFANFTWKHLCWSLFLIKLQVWKPATLLKRDSNTAIFLWNLEIFKNTYFEKNLRRAASASCLKKLSHKIFFKNL